ncbi:Xaa-His dipeptidase [Clostridiaceae bacterium UIB06]|uniref:Xaa-His dipeptidase n=1 Tax=Clostridium thailandense TaxID=2794346 RepID=A0A949X3Y0_9CLOT|nr:Xaa-His dipeptidase [Clostridium thailandense]MBV7273108.1 Xaa-His dipeptidase [Clostridium thailandense]MCH5135772.1 Xaa-His dipeptidase [Clostridiaceae bacterium UIB06]
MKSNEELIKDSLSLVESMVSDGLTDKEIAEKIGMSYSTFRRYKTQNSDLKTAIAQGKDRRNQKVVEALFKCCTGYKYYEEVPTKVKEEVLAEDGRTVLVKEDVLIKSVKKYKGPDLNAQKYWLNNRDKAQWKEDPYRVENDKKLTKLKEKEVEAKTSPI